MTTQEMHRFRVLYEKRGISIFISHRNFCTIIERTLRRLAFPFKFTEGFHPRPRMGFGPALPVGVAGLNEAFDVYAVRTVDLIRLREQANRLLPEGTVFTGAYPVELDRPSVNVQAASASYTIRSEATIEREKLSPLGKILDEDLHYSVIEVRLEKFSHRRLREIVGPAFIERTIHWNGAG